MKKLNLLGISLFTLLLFQGALAQINTLKQFALVERGNDTKIIFDFTGDVPKYDVTYESEGDLSVMVYEFRECETSFEPEKKVVRPVQHMLTMPSKVAGYKSVKVYVYLEKKIPVSHEATTGQLTSTFSWIRVEKNNDPAVLKEMDFRSNEENSLSVKSVFDQVPDEKFVFLLHDKKKIVVVFHNTTEQKEALQPMSSNLITKLQTKRGILKNGQPYSKFIFHSNLEMLMDVAEEPERFFMDFYGVSGQNIDAIVETDVTDPEVVKYQRTGTDPEVYTDFEEPEKESSMKWVYLGLGTGLVVGGAFAGYLYLLDDPGGGPEAIAEPDFGFPPDPPGQ